MSKPLLVEIGCEEIPARFLENLSTAFGKNLSLHLSVEQLLAKDQHGDVYYTPRRIIFHAPALVEQQPDRTEEITGPPVRLARAADGAWTPQAEGFAAKNNVPVKDLYTVKTAKGEYLAVKKATPGRPATDLLIELIPRALGEIELPKAMRWEPVGENDVHFIRPIRWLVGLFGEQIIPFRIGGLTAGRTSQGHRSLGQTEFDVTGGSFPQAWRANHVEIDPKRRRASILAGAGQCRMRRDVELEKTLINLTEWPGVVVGSFEPAYLSSLPHDVLITVMRDHQKYFAVEDAQGQLAPQFIAVINREGDPQGLIRHGNERVLRARFADAQFFWNSDRKLTLSQRLSQLDNITFHIRLGSYRQKTQRLRKLAGWLCGTWSGADTAAAETAAELSKSDLTTDMVKEFTELQGIIGGHYARAEGLDPIIADAIADQYSFDQPPRSVTGAAVSVADKLDTIVGMFAIGEIPTGSADPYGLRRAGNGVVRALIERELGLSLVAAVQQAHAGYSGLPTPEVAGFFKERLGFYLREAGAFSLEVVTAVIAAGADDPLDAARRCAALASAPDTAAVAAVIKRARNIVRKENWTGIAVDIGKLLAPAEQELHRAVAALPSGADYAAELAAIAGLADPMERFFAEVRVNDPDPAVRANRLALLNRTVARCSRLADFSELPARV